jgi:autotransporter-associated beta strand protein
MTVTGTGTIDTNGNAFTLSGMIGGTGGLDKINGGTLTLSGASNYAGATNVNAGTLNLTGSLTSAVNIAGGASLIGTGSTTGTVTINSGGLLSVGPASPANTAGQMTFGGLTLANGSLINFDLGAANAVNNTLNDRIIVNGNVSLGGTLSVAQSAGGTFSPGIYNLISYTGTLGGGTLGLGSLPGGFSGLVQTAVNGQVNLVVPSAPTINL